MSHDTGAVINFCDRAIWLEGGRIFHTGSPSIDEIRQNNITSKKELEKKYKMKFGDDFDRISAAWLRSRIVDRKGSNDKRGIKESLGYIRGGYKKLFDALVWNIKANGGHIHTETPVQQIYAENQECLGVQVNNDICRADVTLSTV